MDADLFAAGSIYYYENTTHTKKDYKDSSMNQDFIVSRPVLILDSNPIPFDSFTVNVVIITSSSNRIGIPINIDGYKDGKILPYAIHSVHKEYLTTYMGKINDDLLSSVREAIKYHLGYSDEIPPYISKYIKESKEREDIINKMTLKEKTVYDFLENKCVFDSNYHSDYNELFRTYSRIFGRRGYSRSQEFSRSLNKYLQLFPQVEVKTENRVKHLYGISIHGNVHKIVSDDEKRKMTTSKNAESSDLSLPNSELRKLISEKSRTIYDKLDTIQKISNYYSSAENMDIDGIALHDKVYVKRMIENDVNRKKNRVLSAMDSGTNPLSMNTIDQYIVYMCKDTEILDHLSEKHRKPGGINRLKRLIRKNISHFFTQVKME